MYWISLEHLPGHRFWPENKCRGIILRRVNHSNALTCDPEERSLVGSVVWIGGGAEDNLVLLSSQSVIQRQSATLDF